MRQHPVRANVINMFVLDFEVVNRGGAGAGEFLLDPDGVAGQVLESLAQAKVHRRNVVVTVLRPDWMVARDPDSLPRRIKARCPRRPRVQQSFRGVLESGEWVSR
jgi:hypothetical protein